MPFWRELKKGSDYFDITKLETPVGVCNKKYVFGATAKSGAFDALSACPPLQEDDEVKTAVANKAAQDDREVAELVGKGVKPIKIVYADGGQNEEFKTQRVAEVSRPDALAAGAQEIALDESPKAKSVAVQVAAAKAATKAGAAKAIATTRTTLASTGPAETSVVPAAFQAAPTAYAAEEPKPGTLGMFKGWFGQGSTPEAAPAVNAQPATPTKIADAAPAPARALPANTGRTATPKTTTVAVDAAPAAPTPASVVSQDEPKSGTLGVIKGWLNLGSSEPAQPVAGAPAPTLAPGKSAEADQTGTGKASVVRRTAKAVVKPAQPAVGKPEQLSSRLPEEITGAQGSWLANLRAFAPID